MQIFRKTVALVSVSFCGLSLFACLGSKVVVEGEYHCKGGDFPFAKVIHSYPEGKRDQYVPKIIDVLLLKKGNVNTSSGEVREAHLQELNLSELNPKYFSYMSKDPKKGLKALVPVQGEYSNWNTVYFINVDHADSRITCKLRIETQTIG